jgi:hypothetical protein
MIIDTTAMNGTWVLRKGVFTFTAARNIRVKDLNAIGWRKWSGTLGALSVIYGPGGNAAGASPLHDITFENLLVKRGSAGFYFGGGVINGLKDTNITIHGCDIGGGDQNAALYYGIQIANQYNLQIIANDIHGLYSQGVAPVTSSPRGLLFAGGGMNTTYVLNNKIHDIQVNVINGVLYGIQIHANGAGGSGASDNWRIFNNMIYDLRYEGTRTGGNYQTAEGVYLYDYGPAPNIVGTVRFYYNTISLTGTPAGAAPYGWTGCFVWSDIAGDNFKLLNNVMSNGRRGPGGGQIRQDWATVSPTTVTLCDNNLYYAYNGVTPQTAWVGANGYIGDGASIMNADPIFYNATTNVHIDCTTVGTVSPANNAGSVVSYITDDIDRQTRSLLTPDIGADEFTPIPWPIDAKPLTILMPLASGVPQHASGVLPQVYVRNNGSNTINIRTHMVIDGGEYNQYAQADAVPALSNATITFPAWDPTTIGSKNVTVITEVYGDNYQANDTLRGTTFVTSLVSSFPYFTNFDDAEAAKYHADGNLFVLGTPVKSILKNPPSAPNCWSTV